MISVTMLSGLGHAVFVAAGLLIYMMGTRIGHQHRHPSAAMAWVLGLITFPYLTLPLFLFFGTRKFARPARRERHQVLAIPQGGPSWATRLLAGMELAPAVHNERVQLHANGDEALRSLLAIMASARQRLDVCTYLFANDDTGRQIAQQLAASAGRGVSVRLLVDAMGSMGKAPAMLRALQRQGVQVRRFMPLLHNPLHGRINLRNHRKLVLADGQRLWSGGRNLASEYFVDRPGQPAWIDLSYEVQGLLAAQAQAQFNTDWRVAHGLALRKARRPHGTPGVHQQPVGGPLAQWLPSGPDHADDTVHARPAAAHRRRHAVLRARRRPAGRLVPGLPARRAREPAGAGALQPPPGRHRARARPAPARCRRRPGLAGTGHGACQGRAHRRRPGPGGLAESRRAQPVFELRGHGRLLWRAGAALALAVVRPAHRHGSPLPRAPAVLGARHC